MPQDTEYPAGARAANLVKPQSPAFRGWGSPRLGKDGEYQNTSPMAPSAECSVLPLVSGANPSRLLDSCQGPLHHLRVKERVIRMRFMARFLRCQAAQLGVIADELGLDIRLKTKQPNPKRRYRRISDEEAELIMARWYRDLGRRRRRAARPSPCPSR